MIETLTRWFLQKTDRHGDFKDISDGLISELGVRIYYNHVMQDPKPYGVKEGDRFRIMKVVHQKEVTEELPTFKHSTQRC